MAVVIITSKTSICAFGSVEKKMHWAMDARTLSSFPSSLIEQIFIFN